MAFSYSIRGERGMLESGAHFEIFVKTCRLTPFYEWSGPKGSKTKHAITAGDGKEWLWIGGIWEPNDDAPEGKSYSMITTSAPSSIEPIHDRCPLVLPFGKVEQFMEADEAPFDLVQPYEESLSIEPPVG